jgi:hypothetical protein
MNEQELLAAAREGSEARSAPGLTRSRPTRAARRRVSRAPRSPKRSRRPPTRSTAPCSAPTRPWTSDCQSGHSRPRCARSKTRSSAGRRGIRPRMGARRHRRARRLPCRGRRPDDASAADVVSRPRRDRGVPERPALSDKFRWRVIPTRANGQPAFGHYIWDDEASAFGARCCRTHTGRRPDRRDHDLPRSRGPHALRFARYSACRPLRARPSVISSAYSRSEPTGRPLARRVTATSGARSCRESAR